MKTIFVASTNPVKINAVQQAFAQYFPENSFTIIHGEIPSGVSAQPISEEETLQGARNRSKQAQELHPDEQFWIGIEGGVAEYNSALFTFAWISIRAQEQNLESFARSASFPLQHNVAELVRGGTELGKADDLVFGTTNSKQKNGAVGILTDDRITRTDLYVPAILLALSPCLQADRFLLELPAIQEA